MAEPSLPASDRLTFRELTLDDLDFVAAMMSHPEVMRHYPHPYSRDEAAAWIQRNLDRYARDGHGLWLVCERAGGAPVGQIGLLMQPVDGEMVPEIGYLLDRPYWKRGYATEGAAAVRDHAFHVRGCARVISLIRPDNLPSQAVARRIGMRESGRTTFRDLDTLVFSLDAPAGGASSTGAAS